MAATKGKLTEPQKENIRSRIQTTQLVKRLQCFALEQPDDAGNVVEIDSGRMKAIEILLRKSLPDLSAVTIDGDMGLTIKLPEGSDKV